MYKRQDDDNIIHVVEDVTKAEAVDPIADIDAIDYELILSDLEVVQNRAGRMAKEMCIRDRRGGLHQIPEGLPGRRAGVEEADAEAAGF